MSNKVIASLVLAVSISGCALNNPDAKGFSEVFNDVWSAYEITVDEANYPTMNYELSLTASSPLYPVIEATLKFNEGSAYLYSRIDYAPEAEATTYFSYVIEGYADYEDGKLYYELFNYETPVEQTTLVETASDYRVITMGEDGQFSLDAVATIRAQIIDTVLPTLGNATVIDLLIGKKIPVEDTYSFSVALNSLVNFSFVEPYLGAVPTSPRLTMTYNRVSFETHLGLTYTLDEISYQADITLNNIDQITDAMTKLTLEQKAVYLAE